jgi:hypothetical protein
MLQQKHFDRSWEYVHEMRLLQDLAFLMLHCRREYLPEIKMSQHYKANANVRRVIGRLPDKTLVGLRGLDNLSSRDLVQVRF